MKLKGRFKFWYVLFALLLFPGYFVMRILQSPKVTISCSVDDEQRLTVKLRPNMKVNGIYYVRFSLVRDGDDEILWTVRKDDAPLRKVVYGEIRDGVAQRYPVGGTQPKPIPRGSTLRVHVEFQYDVFIAASAGGSDALIRVSEDGAVSLTEVP